MLSKIITKSEKERKQKRMQIFFAVFMVGILAASTLGYSLSSSNTNSVKYNGKKFYQTNQGWQGKDLNFFTAYLPQDVEFIPVQGILNLNIFLNKLYVVTDPEQSFSNEWIEWSRAVPMSNPNPSCLPEDEDKEACAELPLKDCNDADLQTAILIFKNTNESYINVNGNCVEIAGDSLDLLKAVDKAIYVMYGVMDP